VEVIGLARYPSDPDKWWAPDGSGPIRAPYLRDSVSPVVDTDGPAYEMVCRIVVPQGLKSHGHSSRVWPWVGTNGLFMVDEFGNRLTELLYAQAYVVKADQTTLNCAIGLALGGWHTALDTDTQGGEGTEDLPEVKFGPLTEVDGKPTIEVAASRDWRGEYITRVEAVARDGSAYGLLSRGGRSDSSGKLTISTLQYDPSGSMPTDFKIARLRFLYCPKQRVTFENLSLAPDRKTEVKITDVTKTGDVAVVSGRLGRRRR